MAKLVLLDTGVLGLATNPKAVTSQSTSTWATLACKRKNANARKPEPVAPLKPSLKKLVEAARIALASKEVEQ